jgi:hypothetical protein
MSEGCSLWRAIWRAAASPLVTPHVSQVWMQPQGGKGAEAPIDRVCPSHPRGVLRPWAGGCQERRHDPKLIHIIRASRIQPGRIRSAHVQPPIEFYSSYRSQKCISCIPKSGFCLSLTRDVGTIRFPEEAAGFEPISHFTAAIPIFPSTYAHRKIKIGFWPFFSVKERQNCFDGRLFYTSCFCERL